MEERRKSPPATSAMPAVAGTREPTRSEIIPLTGAVRLMARNWAVMMIPAFEADKPRPWMR